ncbi:SIMPL domain-containing protein [Chloroflexota bacterium]
MKRKLWLVICPALIIFTLGASGCEGFASPPSTRATPPGSQQNTGIWVTGTGEVTVTPDVAILEVGVEAQETTVAASQTKAYAAMNDVMGALTGSGVAGEDIQTQYFRIRQRTRWDDVRGEEVVTGYQVTNRVTAKIREIEEVGSIIDATVTAGGDLIRINDLSFSVDDPLAYYDEAREKAAADARERAEKLAAQTGVKLGEPTYVAESTYMPPAYQGITYAISEGPMPAPAPAPPSISPGEVKITLTVQIAYGIR